MRSSWLLPLVALSLACAPTLATTLAIEEGVAPETCGAWTAREPMCAPELTLFDDRGLARPIAVLVRPGYAPMTWALPEDEADRAEASALVDGFELTGWALLGERRFPLRAPRTLLSVLHAPAGLPVRIVGRDQLGLRVELPAPFRAPSSVRTTIACDDLGAPASGEAPRTGIRVAPHGPLALAATPGGAIAATVELFDSVQLELIAERDGWVHVVGPRNDAETLTLDGWVTASSITRDVEASSDSGCDPPDDHDVCPEAVVGATATIDVGPEPGARTSLRVRAGTEVRVLEQREGYAAILPARDGLRPPEGARFWIATEALSLCSEESAACGCP